MHIKENLINFLYDKKYFITIYDEFIHIFNYKDLVSLNDKVIMLRLNDFKIKISGSNLYIIKMFPSELLIKGNIIMVEKIYE